MKQFTAGLNEVIDTDILNMFFPDEVQLLISGGLNEIDINDLRQHTSYNGYSANEGYIRDFWAYLEQLPNK